MSFNKKYISDLINHQKGYAFKSKNYQSDGIPVVRVSNFSYNSIERDDLKYVSNEVASKNKKVALKENDVVIATVGSWPNNPASIVGKTIRVPKDLNGALMNQNSVILRVKNGNIKDQKYLYWCLKSEKFSNYIVSTAQGSANQASIKLKDIFAYKIPWFTDNYRDKIVDILESFDKKIHLNQQTNETLEAMAQAIFKSWFVDFDPVRAKIEAQSTGRDPHRAAMATIASISPEQDRDQIETALDQKLAGMNESQQQQLHRTAELFPAELVESELGEVPKGWEVVELKKVIKNYDRKRVPLSRREREERPGKYPYYGATSIMDYVDDYLFEGRNVLMAEDGSVMDDDGKPVLQYVDGKIWVNNHAHVLNGIAPITNEILYLFLKTVSISPYVTGAVQKKINQGNMNSIPFLLADKNIYGFISPLLKGLFDKIIQGGKENENLKNLRDALLPKLISGDIEV